MSLFRLPCSKLPLAFLAVPASKDGWVECPCQTVDDFIGQFTDSPTWIQAV